MSTEKTIYLGKNEPDPALGRMTGGSAAPEPRAVAQGRRFLLAVVVLVACFSVPLYRLARFALSDELYSYVLLMPVVTWYLLRLKKTPSPESEPATAIGALFLLAGAIMTGIYFAFVRSPELELEDYLSINAFAFFLFIMGAAGVCLGREAFRAAAFPLGMLIFIVPMPVMMRENVVTFLQYGSAYVADGMFRASFSTFSRDGLDFALPGTPGLEVAPECSGIHSSWILLITSLLAGYLFLRSPLNRGILALAVLPLALLRNGFRVFTIGQLCVHIGPEMIDSVIHRKGGPIFFALSMIPFLLLLAWLHRREHRLRPNQSVSA